MTRINLVDPSELATKFLVAEYREIVRVFALARKSQHEMHKKKIPDKFTLGIGHQLFFYDKLSFISERYDLLCAEMKVRGYKCNRVPKEDLHTGIGKHMFFGYKATEEAIRISKERIALRSAKL